METLNDIKWNGMFWISQKFDGKTGDESDAEDETDQTSTNVNKNTVNELSDSDNEDHVMLAKPEFDGMWDSHKPYKAPKGDLEAGPKLPGASKMERVRYADRT